MAHLGVLATSKEGRYPNEADIIVPHHGPFPFFTWYFEGVLKDYFPILNVRTPDPLRDSYLQNFLGQSFRRKTSSRCCTEYVGNIQRSAPSGTLEVVDVVLQSLRSALRKVDI